MPNNAKLLLTTQQLNWLNDNLANKVPTEARQLLNQLPAEDIAHLLESSPPKHRSVLWKLLDSSLEGAVLSALTEEVRQFFIESMNVAELAQSLSDQDSHDLADILTQLPDTIVSKVLDCMTSRDQMRVKQVLSYPEGTVGRLIDTNVLSVNPHLSIQTVLHYFRHEYEKTHHLLTPLDEIYVLNEVGVLIGVVPYAVLLSKPADCLIVDVMKIEYFVFDVLTKQQEIITTFERHRFVSAPVIDSNKKFIGRLTIDDVMSLIREEANNTVLNMAGLDDCQDAFASAWKTTKSRSIWLGVNLLTAFLSSSVINFFHDTLEQVIVLAILMPIVASMGGNAGCQAMTMMLRLIAQNQVTSGNIRWLLGRELQVGLLNGLIWGSIVSLLIWFWFSNLLLAGVLALAMLINLSIAVILGASIPSLLQYFKVDPTVAGTVILTATTDAVGFCCFFGLATLFFR
ncbi:MAG: magnesium transporter [Endozoicomonadaceae bacterium]|nr:magnesium transporter [Endozoicomonadaceae bacterium]